MTFLISFLIPIKTKIIRTKKYLAKIIIFWIKTITISLILIILASLILLIRVNNQKYYKIKIIFFLQIIIYYLFFKNLI